MRKIGDCEIYSFDTEGGQHKIIIKTKDEYIFTEIGECELRGRDKKVKLQTVQKIL